ncbi:MAG: diadenylate cyclase CdaA [Bacteroidales bacterium]|nr:diadenylate cyclase CdaA [Bacteroidales bacterium]
MPLLFVPAFLQVRLLDVIDIILVAILLYQLYLLIRGTGALNIFVGILSIYLVWWLVQIFEMELLTAILGQFISVGVLALIIVFQPEIRKFLLLVGTRSFINKPSRKFFNRLWQFDDAIKLNISPIVNSCQRFSENRTGALIVVTKENDLTFFVETGEMIDARISEQLLENIFYKNSPLHDGAVIITSNRIKAARCVLPVSESKEIPSSLGLRHRAAAGITEQSDAIAIVVSEQTGRISVAKSGEIKRNLKPVQLKEILAREFGIQQATAEKEPEKTAEP